MTTFTVLKHHDYTDEGRNVWLEVGTLESEYVHYIDADVIGKQYGAGEFLLIEAGGQRCISKRIVAEARYSDAEDDEPEDDGDEQNDSDPFGVRASQKA